MAQKLSESTIDFFVDAVSKSKNISDIVANPKKFVRSNKEIVVSDIEGLKQKGKDIFKEQDASVQKEIISFANAVSIRGGKHLTTWHLAPAKTAKELGLTLSPEAVKVLKSTEFSDILKTMTKGGTEPTVVACVAIIIIIVIVLIPSCTPKQALVLDFSEKTKI